MIIHFSQKLKKALIYCGIFYYTISAFCWSYPTLNSYVLKFNGFNENWMLWSGLWQRWEMFNLYPGKKLVLNASVSLPDGTLWSLTPPRLNGLRYNPKYFVRRQALDPKFHDEMQNVLSLIKKDFCKYAKLNFEKDHHLTNYKMDIFQKVIDPKITGNEKIFVDLGECPISDGN